MAESTIQAEIVTSPQLDYDRLRYVSDEAPCPYLDGHVSRSEAYAVGALAPDVYRTLMDYGFRRSGRLVYRPRCRGCRECVPLRVPVATFVRSRSMRRVWARNADLRVELSDLTLTEEKHALYRAYLDDQHDDTMSRTFETLKAFLYDSPAETDEFCYYLGRRLVGVSVVDRCVNGLSSVYMFFDPAARARSLGTFSVLWEIEHCRRLGFAYYYLGYYVAGSKTMEYKARFRPNELLSEQGGWAAFRE